MTITHRIASAISNTIRETMRASVVNLRGSNLELRTVFHGPPMHLLEQVYRALVETGWLEVDHPTGGQIQIPVLLQVGKLPDGAPNPPAGTSGFCDGPYLVSLRNTPSVPRYLALTPPGGHRVMSITQATDEFGLSATNNGGSASIEDWWDDAFVQELVASALRRHKWASIAEQSGAAQLVKTAVQAADSVGHLDSSRTGPWNVLSRVWSIANLDISFPSQLSLACAFPPVADGSLQVKEQEAVLSALSEALAAEGFKSCIQRLAAGASAEVAEALTSFLDHIQKCDAPTALERSAAFYYAPFTGSDLQAPPSWWTVLTVETWTDLLEEEKRPEGSLLITCTNSIIPSLKGSVAVVLDTAEIDCSLPDDHQGSTQAKITRIAGSAANEKSWSLKLLKRSAVQDTDIPRHRSPLRYTGEVEGLRKASIKVISLATWDAGIFVHSKTAKKISPPKQVKSSGKQVVRECSLNLIGHGRHYLDVFVSPNVSIGEVATGKDSSGAHDVDTQAAVSRVSEHSFGLEIDATAECQYELLVQRPGGADELLRVSITSDETEAEGSASEFERLIRLNRQRQMRATTEVVIDRQIRSVDLQTWLLAEKTVERSFYPLVFAADYANAWRAPEWRNEENTIFSKGKFLHDPRPPMAEMEPPPGFLEARKLIAKIIRGDEETGVFEAARLGELLLDPQFAEVLEQYVSEYQSWLIAAPDVAPWCDTAIANGFESDKKTLAQEPDAILVSPLHPLRLGWHALAQNALFSAYQSNVPCPAASVLDPDMIPDVVALPLRTATGSTRHVTFFSVECSSDYWSVLWNGNKLDRLATRSRLAPFDREFGVELGGVSSGFSVAQVRRAMNDAFTLLCAKPVINITVSSSAGQSNACNEGLLSWANETFSSNDETDQIVTAAGQRIVQIFDDRPPSALPEDASISNLAEDTAGSVRWYGKLPPGIKPDLGIIAQLETSNAEAQPMEIGSPVGIGALLRYRVRRQLSAGDGAFLSESRMGIARRPSSNGLADKVMAGIVHLENLGTVRYGYTFAPSVHAIEDMLEKKNADFVAVSSSAVDPASFLGDWLKGAYLWDYELPSYSHRAGDVNGYYLLSQVKDIDRDTLQRILAKLPDCEGLDESMIDLMIREVSRRGIPTVRGLSGGERGASGDLGLLVASRFLQDEFREGDQLSSLLPVWKVTSDEETINLIVPVDPFEGYLGDLQHSLGTGNLMRPDLMIVALTITDSSIRCRVTPMEVKYRSTDSMNQASLLDALSQARSLSSLLRDLQGRAAEPDMLLWKLAFQHLLLSMIGFAFRVYSQQKFVSHDPQKWAELHSRISGAILSDELEIDIDESGRLLVIDASPNSAPRDVDGDGFAETIVLSATDAAQVAVGSPIKLYGRITRAVGTWRFTPVSKVPVGGVPVLPRGKSNLPTPPAAEPPNGAGHPPAAVPATNVKKAVTAITAEGNPTTKTGATMEDAGIELLIGSATDGFTQTDQILRLSDTRLNQLNMGIVGDLGTGKTQLLKSLIYQARAKPFLNRGIKPRFLIFDYKNDYQSADFVEAVGAKVVLPHNLPINLFDVSTIEGSVTPWLDRFGFFIDVLSKIFPGIGPVQRNRLKQAVKQSYEEARPMGRQPTVYDVHAKYRAALDAESDAPFAILDDMVDRELFAREPDGGGVEEFLDGVVVIALDKLGQDDKAKNMLVAIMLNVFYDHMLKIPKRPFIGSDPQLRAIDSFLLVDEANNIMKYEFDVLRRILLQGREFGVGVILASQYLRHFKEGATDYREPLLTWCIHKVPNVSPAELSALGLTGDVANLTQRVKSLTNHELLFKTYDVNGAIVTGLPFFKLVRPN